MENLTMEEKGLYFNPVEIILLSEVVSSWNAQGRSIRSEFPFVILDLKECQSKKKITVRIRKKSEQ